MPSPLDSNVAKASSLFCFGCLCQYVVWLASKPLPLCKAQRTTGRCQVSFSCGGWGVAAWHQFRGFQWFHGVSALRTNLFRTSFVAPKVEFFLEAQWCQRTGSSETTALANAQSKIHSCKQLIVGICCYCLLYPPQALNALRYQTALQL